MECVVVWLFGYFGLLCDCCLDGCCYLCCFVGCGLVFRLLILLIMYDSVFVVGCFMLVVCLILCLGFDFWVNVLLEWIGVCVTVDCFIWLVCFEGVVFWLMCWLGLILIALGFGCCGWLYVAVYLSFYFGWLCCLLTLWWVDVVLGCLFSLLFVVMVVWFVDLVLFNLFAG